MPRSTPDLSRRTQPADLPELMDEPCARDELRACLRDLARVNRMFVAYRPILLWLDRLKLQDLSGPVRILDVGSGYGDTLRRIGRWAQTRGIAVELTGLDLNADATAIAAEASPAASGIRWVTGDVFRHQPPQAPHLILSSLFAHHLADEEVVRFVEWMERSALLGWFVNDLSRHPTPYRLFGLFSRLVRLHRFVRHDGPVSFARAFVVAEWERYCAGAGLRSGDVEIRGFTPARLCVSRIKTAGESRGEGRPGRR